MKRQPQNSLDSKQTSIITALYRAWDQHHIPAIHYHYTLSILSKQTKKQQIRLMSSQLNRLKQGKDHYQLILKWLKVRQNSLSIINSYISVLRNTSNQDQLECSEIEQESIEDFKLLYESRTKERRTNRKLEQLINHIKNYQLATYQVTKGINNWQHQNYQLGYDGLVQFLYHHEDYLEKMLGDSNFITDNYSQFFEKNMFLIFKKEHQFSQYSLIYENLRFNPGFAVKIEEALEVISNHHAELERYRILGNYRQLGSRKKLEKIESMKGIYCSYNRNTVIVKDRELVGDKLKFMDNKNVLINPEAPTLTRFSQKYPVMIHSRASILSKNNSEIRLQPLSHRTKIIVDEPRSPRSPRLEDKLSQRKLIMLHDLTSANASSASLPHAPSIPYQNESLRLRQTEPTRAIRPETPIKKTQSHLSQSSITDYKVQFIYEKDINPKEIFHYLRSDIFNDSSRDSVDIESMAKTILEERDRITFIRAIAKSMLVAWLAIIFVNKDHSLKKSVEVKIVHKFLKIPNFQTELVEQFLKKGYGIVRMNSKVMSECIVKQKMGHPLIYVHYKLREEDQSVIKKIIKSDDLLKNSRVLKYYTYSKDTKYHIFCEHRKNQCKVSFYIQQAAKISIEGQTFIKVKCDSIKKIGAVWKIAHHLNKLSLLIGESTKDIYSFSHLSQIDFNSSFQSGQDQNEKKYMCVPQIKCMHKYVNSQQKSIVAQYLKINGQIPEIRSLRVERKQLKDCLIVQRPFVAAFVCNSKQDYGKTVALLNFD